MQRHFLLYRLELLIKFSNNNWFTFCLVNDNFIIRKPFKCSFDSSMSINNVLSFTNDDSVGAL